MTTQTTDVQSTNQAHKSRLEHRSSHFEILNFLTPPIMGKPKLAVAATILAGAVSASGAQAKEGELRLASLGNEGNNVPTQYEGESIGQEQLETTLAAQKARLIAQIEMGEKTCPTLKQESKKAWRKCKREEVTRPTKKLSILEKNYRIAELTQKDKKLDTEISELVQANQKLDEEGNKISKELAQAKAKNAALQLNIAALEALKKVKDKMKSE